MIIDEFVLVDSSGFESVIDAAGENSITVLERIEDDAYPTGDLRRTALIIEAGRQDMNGETALGHARTRHQDNDGKRRDRQRLVLRAILDQTQAFESATRITQLIRAGGSTVLTSISWEKQLALVNVALEISQSDIVMKIVTEPLVLPGTSQTGAWIYIGDPVEIGDFIYQVFSGKSPDS